MNGRDELLNEAIAKAKEAEDWQLVEWLRMARGSDSAARWYSDKLREAHRTERKLLDENAKLRELVLDMWEGYNDPRCEDCYLKDTPTCADCPICAREASVIDRMQELGVKP